MSSEQVTPIHAEDAKDPFDRQRCILEWKQGLIEKQVALVLGAGGLGCSVSMSLCRLGVRILVEMA